MIAGWYPVLWLPSFLFLFAGNWFLISLINPCSAILANKGLITPPWGVPESVSSNIPLSITPHFSHCLMTILTLLGQSNLDSRWSWLILSKHLDISASRAHLAFELITVYILCIASCALLPGRKP